MSKGIFPTDTAVPPKMKAATDAAMAALLESSQMRTGIDLIVAALRKDGRVIAKFGRRTVKFTVTPDGDVESEIILI
jgi:hypothetical protein